MSDCCENLPYKNGTIGEPPTNWSFITLNFARASFFFFRVGLEGVDKKFFYAIELSLLNIKMPAPAGEKIFLQIFFFRKKKRRQLKKLKIWGRGSKAINFYGQTGCENFKGLSLNIKFFRLGWKAPPLANELER